MQDCPGHITAPARITPVNGAVKISIKCLVAIFAGMLAAPKIFSAQSQWVYYGHDSKLAYKTLPEGDRIMDFSYAGYMGGGVKIPGVRAMKTVRPSGGDDTAAIQNAIDEVSAMPLQNGFRGAVLLAPGTFNCNRTLAIKSSGVVLRGSGTGENGTTIKMTGNPHLCLFIGTSAEAMPDAEPVSITDDYVPSGANCFHIADAAKFQPGDVVLIDRPATPAWVKFMGMDTLVRHGREEHWVSGEMHTERVIKNISGNLITLEVPLADSFDARYLNPPGGSVVKCSLGSRPTQIGAENFRIVAPALATTIDHPLFSALHMDGVSDAWVRDLHVENTMNSFRFGANTSRITIEYVNIRHAVASIGAAKPEDFWTGGTQTLVSRCTDVGNNVFYFSTGPRMMGPVAVLDCTFRGDGHIQPHMRWATGLLVDNCKVPDGGIDLMDRGIMGSGHGWTVGWAVAWNCLAKTYTIQQPPGSMNWAIGCVGRPLNSSQPGDQKKILPNGIFESLGAPVEPASLYLAQLRERLGPQALANIGY